jgi:hypothetical protein
VYIKLRNLGIKFSTSFAVVHNLASHFWLQGSMMIPFFIPLIFILHKAFLCVVSYCNTTATG